MNSLVFGLIAVTCVHSAPYKYRYEEMKTAETGQPFRGYRIIEDYQPNYNQQSFSNYQPFPRFQSNYPSFNFGTKYTNTLDTLGPKGNEFIKKESFDKKQVKDEGFEKKNEESKQMSNQEQEGYKQNQAALHDLKDNQGYYKKEEGDKKSLKDEKHYDEGKEYNQEGKLEGEKKHKASHRKGHVIKGFKTTHHKDETGKTEEYYDEEHDEGGESSFDGKSGSFEEKSKTKVEGGHENHQFKTGEENKQGRYDSKQLIDKNNGDKGQYEENKYYGNGQTYAHKNDVDQQSLLGHQEANKIYNQLPYHTPFD